MTVPKFTAQDDCNCRQHDSVCRCDEADKYNYIRENLLKLQTMSLNLNSTNTYIEELLKEVDK